MPVTLASLNDLNSLPFDDIIDVRSPAEYAEDHIPGAISLPVLSNEERAKVGTIYSQVNPFEARKVGAALVAKNAARHIQESLADRPHGYRPLVYCWRGGQRSGSFSLILRQIGWRADTVEGGYRAYRRLVSHAMQSTPWPCPVVMLDGNTGTAKTALLHLAKLNGVQVLDLEGLANHRGSLFGACAGGQPSQKAFESALAQLQSNLDPARPVLVEAESSKVGKINLPPTIWGAMKTAPRIEVSANLDARAAYLTRAYGDVAQDQARLEEIIDALSDRHAADQIAAWKQMARAGQMQILAQELMQSHYDPRYTRQRARYEDRTIARLSLPGLAPDHLTEAAQQITRLVEGFTST